MFPFLVLVSASNAPVTANVMTDTFRKRRFIFLKSSEVANIFPTKILPGCNSSKHQIGMENNKYKTKKQTKNSTNTDSAQNNIGF